MAFQRMFDSDPDTGAGRYVVYEVWTPGTNPDAEGWRQKYHPSDTAQGKAAHTHKSLAEPKTKPCATLGCKNKAGERKSRCSTCTRKFAACACGRRMSRDSGRCQVCVSVDRRRKPQAWTL